MKYRICPEGLTRTFFIQEKYDDWFAKWRDVKEWKTYSSGHSVQHYASRLTFKSKIEAQDWILRKKAVEYELKKMKLEADHFEKSNPPYEYP